MNLCPPSSGERSVHAREHDQRTSGLSAASCLFSSDVGRTGGPTSFLRLCRSNRFLLRASSGSFLILVKSTTHRPLPSERGPPGRFPVATPSPLPLPTRRRATEEHSSGGTRPFRRYPERSWLFDSPPSEESGRCRSRDSALRRLPAPYRWITGGHTSLSEAVRT